MRHVPVHPLLHLILVGLDGSDAQDPYDVPDDFYDTLDPSQAEVCPGRPFHQEGQGLQAPVTLSSGWSRLATAEHASIAAFAGLQLDLLALGAPLALLQDVAAAMDDEVRHARLALQQADHASTEGVAIGRFPFRTPIQPTRDLVTLAVAAVHEGCIGETLSAVATRRAAELARDPDQAELLRSIADDEDRHVVLSWRLVAWALEEGGQPVCDAVRQAFSAALPQVDFPLLDRDEGERLQTRAASQVLAPAMRALLDPKCLPAATV